LAPSQKSIPSNRDEIKGSKLAKPLAGQALAQIRWKFSEDCLNSTIMSKSEDDFRAWYENDSAGKSRIKVKGTATEVGGGTTTIVRANPQGINPRVLLLKLHVEPYPGQFHPHTAIDKEVTYDELSARGSFSDVMIERETDSFTLKVEPGAN
jgi:hypothetical protein